nr:MAG TPA: hypothetical protein [Caudoviricetes sp.]
MEKEKKPVAKRKSHARYDEAQKTKLKSRERGLPLPLKFQNYIAMNKNKISELLEAGSARLKYRQCHSVLHNFAIWQKQHCEVVQP